MAYPQKNRAFIFLALLGIIAAWQPCHAWDAKGHRRVAALAWGEMTPFAKKEATMLLRRHPDYKTWIARQKEQNTDYGVFQEAAVWADEIRHDPRFHDDNKPKTPLLKGFPDMLRHTGWHYQETLAGGRKKGEIASRLEQLAQVLETPLTASNTPQKVYALPWFLHLMGDIHQPLHTGGRDDQGGNAFHVRLSSRINGYPVRPGWKALSLHAYWDSLPWENQQRANTRKLLGKTQTQQGNPTLWLKENQKWRKNSVYPAKAGIKAEETLKHPVEISPEFHHRAQKLAKERLAAAGIRTGRWLNELLTR